MGKVSKIPGLLSLVLFLSIRCISQSEISLYDSKGNAIAYIATDDDNTIYMWQGKPVAYLINDGNDIHIYSFSGSHLGWYRSGIVFDHDGNIVGFIKGAVSNIYLNYEEYKGYKEYKPYKGYKEYAPYKPYWNSTFSNTPLSLFLQLDDDDNTTQRRIFHSSPPVMETDLNLMERVLIQKQKQFDQHTQNVQNEINNVYYGIAQLKSYDTAYANSLLVSLNKYLSNLNGQSIDYSDINNYNQVMNGLNSYTNALNVAQVGIDRLMGMNSELSICSGLVDELVAINPILKEDVYKDYDSCILVYNRGYSYFNNQSNFNNYSMLVTNLKARLKVAFERSKENKYVYWVHSGTFIFIGGEPLDQAIKRNNKKQKSNAIAR